MGFRQGGEGMRLKLGSGIKMGRKGEGGGIEVASSLSKR